MPICLLPNNSGISRCNCCTEPDIAHFLKTSRNVKHLRGQVKIICFSKKVEQFLTSKYELHHIVKKNLVGKKSVH